MKVELFQYLLNVLKLDTVHFTEYNDMYNIDYYFSYCIHLVLINIPMSVLNIKRYFPGIISARNPYQKVLFHSYSDNLALW